MDRPLSKPRQPHGTAITANSCPGTIIHFVAAALLLMHAARPPRRPSRLGLGRRLASWHPRKKRRPPTAGDLTARADQQPNPKTRAAERLEVVHLGDNFHSVVAYYGFMQNPNVPRVLERCSSQGLQFNMMDTSFFVGRVSIVPERSSRFRTIRCKLFEPMHRNALDATEFFRIPPNRVIELGGQVAI